jgi:hypothetical protein
MTPHSAEKKGDMDGRSIIFRVNGSCSLCVDYCGFSGIHFYFNIIES